MENCKFQTDDEKIKRSNLWNNLTVIDAEYIIEKIEHLSKEKIRYFKSEDEAIKWLKD